MTKYKLICDGNSDPSGYSGGCGHEWIIEDGQDMECPSCGSIYPSFDEVEDDRPSDVQGSDG